jgi:hypothetical protein
MNITIKDLLRKEQMEAFQFFHTLVRLQHEKHRYFSMENPRSSELLNQPLCLDLLKKYGGEDKVTCMCSHGLMDIDSGKAYMKQTTLRGNVSLQKSIRWCKCTTNHELMQGHNRNGSLRTANAQGYTKLFCLRLAEDCHNHLKALKRIHVCFEEDPLQAFPTTEGTPNPAYRPRDAQAGAESDEEVILARTDPYRIELTDEQVSAEADRQEEEMRRTRANNPRPISQPYKQPTAKTLPRPNMPVNPPPAALLPEPLVPTNPSDMPAPRDTEVQIDDLPVAQELIENELQLSVKKPVLNDDRIVLAEVASTGV